MPPALFCNNICGDEQNMTGLFAQQMSIDAKLQQRPLLKLNQLSNKERSLGLEELHGVADLEEEEPSRISSLLDDLDESLNQIQLSNNPNPSAYKQAVSVNPTFVERYRLLCLRAENYNPQKAAANLARFFQLKLDLFGNEKLTEDIRYQDLSEEDVKHLKTGFLQQLPRRDRSGRVIFMIIGLLNLGVPIKTLVSGGHDEILQGGSSVMFARVLILLVFNRFDC
jgi:hypothetical protein